MAKRKLLTRAIGIVSAAILLFSNGAVAFADIQEPLEQRYSYYLSIERVNDAECNTPTSYEIQTGRHYNVKEEVEKDTITDRWLYPEGQHEGTALRKVYCSSFIHYRVYRMRVGDPDYKAFLYDEYKATWKGYERSSASSSWVLKYNYKNQTTRDRGLFIFLIGELTSGHVVSEHQ